MAQSIEFESVYLEAQFCKECRWFERPLLDWPPHPPRAVCPRCGDKLRLQVGKYRIRETRRLFGTRREYLSFTPRATKRTRKSRAA